MSKQLLQTLIQARSKERASACIEAHKLKPIFHEINVDMRRKAKNPKGRRADDKDNLHLLW